MIKYNENEIYLEPDELKIYFTLLNKQELEKLKEYYILADNDLKDSKRYSGAPTICHSLAVSKIVHDLNSDPQTIYSALLHHCSQKLIESIKNKDPEVYELLQLLHEKNDLKKRAEDYNYSLNLKRTLLIAGLKDFRTLIIWLANRVHNLKTIQYLPQEKQIQIAKETLEIYAPIAHKLGINALKVSLEDIPLKILYPEVYEKINKDINQRYKEADVLLKELHNILLNLFPQHRIEGRIKHLYSVLKKLEESGKKLDEIYDFIALRIITKTVEECYLAMEIMKDKFEEIPGRFKDYIQHPKPNGYKSLHNCFYYKGKPFEIQIRTEDMHYFAEYGVAAHWKYKNIEADKLDKFFFWNKQIISILPILSNKPKFSAFEEKIFVFTPKGDPIELPKGGTALDFAFKVHTDIGIHAQYAKINGQKMPLNTELKSGDIVEIVTSPKPQINEKWLSIVKSNSVKSMIRGILGMSKKSKKEETSVAIKKLIDHNKDLKIAGCCSNIKYGEPIVLVHTKTGEVVHRENCQNILPIFKKEPLKWKQRFSKIYIYGKDEDGILLKILSKIREKVKLQAVDASAESGRFKIILKTNHLSENEEKEISKEIRSVSKNINTVEIKDSFD
ncbi:MAG: HD domain-containing protein [Candidatus Woesearchaeota archaeon]